MKLLKEAIQEKKFDARVVEKGLLRGGIKSDEYEAHLKTLRDDSENAVTVKFTELEHHPEANGAHSINSHGV